MNRLISIASAEILSAGGAFAQQPVPMAEKAMPGKDMEPGIEMEMDKNILVPNATDTPSTAAYRSSMMKLMMAMPKYTGDADTEAAIDMAKIVLANGKDADTKKLAEEIIAAQEKEIAVIDGWLQKKWAEENVSRLTKRGRDE